MNKKQFILYKKLFGRINHHQLHGILSPNEDWGVHFLGPVGGLHFHMDRWGDSFIWGKSQLGISLGGLQYQHLAQLANAGPKSVKVNLTNCLQRSL